MRNLYLSVLAGWITLVFIYPLLISLGIPEELTYLSLSSLPLLLILIYGAFIVKFQHLMQAATGNRAPGGLTGLFIFIISVIWWARKNGAALHEAGVDIMHNLGVGRLFFLFVVTLGWFLYPVVVISLFMDA
ncbi:MAG: hypothetical protein Q9O62_09020 [Ardenticatenia bacterium]|nr:hypothetical protein [Ardenticatenia bacterium]